MKSLQKTINSFIKIAKNSRGIIKKIISNLKQQLKKLITFFNIDIKIIKKITIFLKPKVTRAIKESLKNANKKVLHEEITWDLDQEDLSKIKQTDPQIKNMLAPFRLIFKQLDKITEFFGNTDDSSSRSLIYILTMIIFGLIAYGLVLNIINIAKVPAYISLFFIAAIAASIIIFKHYAYRVLKANKFEIFLAAEIVLWAVYSSFLHHHIEISEIKSILKFKYNKNLENILQASPIVLNLFSGTLPQENTNVNIALIFAIFEFIARTLIVFKTSEESPLEIKIKKGRLTEETKQYIERYVDSLHTFLKYRMFASFVREETHSIIGPEPELIPIYKEILEKYKTDAPEKYILKTKNPIINQLIDNYIVEVLHKKYNLNKTKLKLSVFDDKNETFHKSLYELFKAAQSKLKLDIIYDLAQKLKDTKLMKDYIKNLKTNLKATKSSIEYYKERIKSKDTKRDYKKALEDAKKDLKRYKLELSRINKKIKFKDGREIPAYLFHEYSVLRKLKSSPMLKKQNKNPIESFWDFEYYLDKSASNPFKSLKKTEHSI